MTRESARRFTLLAAIAALGIAPAARAQSATLLRLRNAASADRLVVDSAGGLVVLGSAANGTIPYSGTGFRMMWYPRKAAFRVGSSDSRWDDGFIGLYSFATNVNTIASGQGSSAFGVATQATGNYAFAAGEVTHATADDATATGYQTTASGTQSFAGGGFSTAGGARSMAFGSSASAGGAQAVALGTNVTASGLSSVALGYYASAGYDGDFVFGDASGGTSLSATVAHQFSVKASGGVRFFTSSNLSTGVTLAAGGGSWSTVSDRRRKEAFLDVDGEEVLARIRTLSLSTWRYIAEQDRSTRHMGPMAQDWYRAFGFSRDSLTINTGDIDGVNLAGVQALEARTRAQAERIAALEEQNRALQREASVRDRALTDALAQIAELRAAVTALSRGLPAVP